MKKAENKKCNIKALASLFLTFLKIGAFTFGGGYAMIALLENEFVAKKKWIDNEEFLNMVTIAESTPGPIAINSATYLGYKVCGFWGSLLATLGVCIPSFSIIYIISLFFDRFIELKLVGYAFKGIRVCVVYIIFSAGIKLAKGIKKNIFNCIILFSSMICLITFSLLSVNFSTVFYILICGFIGFAAYLIKRASKGGKCK